LNGAVGEISGCTIFSTKIIVKNLLYCNKSNTFAGNNKTKDIIMERLNIENIYSEILLLSDGDRDKLYNRIKRTFYQNGEIIAYTSDGEALTYEQYNKRVNAGIEQCMRGESISLEELTKELGYNYADL
jgi:hypothetical protein